MNGGTLRVGSEEEPFEEDFNFKLHGHWHTPRIPVFGSKVIGLTTGNLLLHGKPVEQTWVELEATADAGASELRVLGEAASK